MPEIVFLQSQVSQLDQPVYARLHEIAPGKAGVVYWNDYGVLRRRVDPELGIVPDLVELDIPDYPWTWIDSRKGGYREVLDKVIASKPALVVLSDQRQIDRLRLALAIRRKGIKVALRSDKNYFSERPRSGLPLIAEQQFTRRTFDVMAPTSPLTLHYYNWPQHQPTVLSPYPTNEQKFSPRAEIKLQRRKTVRAELGISNDAFVFLSATKFSTRESPWELIESFAAMQTHCANVHLIAVGDGPMLSEIKQSCANRGITRVSFPGFVPFRELQNYFFASDVYLHLVSIGPWEVSPQDALVAGLGLVSTNNVGSANVFLKGELARFLVPFGDRASASARMTELVKTPNALEQFKPAKLLTEEYTVAATAMRWSEVV
jgi:glycosyltransferase involved in cell wall biosynthesis